MLAPVLVAMVLQRDWLSPILDQRVSQLLAGGTLSFSIHHLVYAVLEASKVTLLMTGAGVEYRSQLWKLIQSSGHQSSHTELQSNDDKLYFGWSEILLIQPKPAKAATFG